MKTIKSILLVVISVMACSAAFAARTAMMETFDNIPVATLTGTELKLEQVKKAILAGAQKRDWIAKETSPKTITAGIFVRGQFRVTVEIVYSAEQFSVKYKDSENLNYESTAKGAKIHRSYNKWVQALVGSIRNELSAL
ncbi:MAG: hypothetical protein H7Y02_03315 [Candidatus Obscuribacterales bacterium]|nr:hypothetical protein [Steroidobacteraceae bacterium]